MGELEQRYAYEESVRLAKEQATALQPFLESEYGLKPIYGTDPYQQKLLSQIDALRGIERTKGHVVKGGTDAIDTPEIQELVKRLEATTWTGGAIGQTLLGYERTPEAIAAKTRQTELQELSDIATKRQFGLLELSAERQEKALRGELPLSEMSLARKQQEFSALKENLARAGSPIIGDTPETAYALSTAGTQSLEGFQKTWKLIEDAERRGEIAQGAGIYQSGLGLGANLSATGRAAGLAYGATGAQGPLSGGTLGIAPYQFQAQQPYQFDRSLAWQMQQQNEANRAANRAGWAQLGGQLGSAALIAAGYYFGGPVGGAAAGAVASKTMGSDRSFKKDIREATPKDEERSLKAMMSPKTYRYNYKEEPDGPPRRIGFMADEAPREIIHDADDRYLDIPKTLGLLTASVRTLARKMDTLEKEAA